MIDGPLCLMASPVRCLAREASFVKRESQDGRSTSVSLHARYGIRFTRNALLSDFATNRHELCGLGSTVPLPVVQ